MKVIVLNDRAEPIWERANFGGQYSGMTSTSYLQDGTHAKIIEALEEALIQVRGEASILNPNAVLDGGSPAAEIDNHVPIATVGNGYTRREVGESAAVVPEGLPASVGAKIRIIQEHEVALMTALQHGDVPG